MACKFVQRIKGKPKRIRTCFLDINFRLANVKVKCYYIFISTNQKTEAPQAVLMHSKSVSSTSTKSRKVTLPDNSRLAWEPPCFALWTQCWIVRQLQMVKATATQKPMIRSLLMERGFKPTKANPNIPAGFRMAISFERERKIRGSRERADNWPW